MAAVSRYWIFLIVLAACGSGDAKPSNTPPPIAAKPIDAAVVAGAKPEQYVTLCAICHGAEGKGYAADHAPSLVTPTFLESATDAFLFEAIAKGRPGTSMAAYSKALNGPLADEQITAMVAWLRTQGPSPKALIAEGPGDAKRGGDVYAKSCLSCHGDAKARGEGISLGNTQFLRTATKSFVRHAIINGRPGTKMEAWKDKLTEQQLDDVIAFVFDGLGQLDQTPAQQLPPPTGKEPLVINPSGANPKFSPRSDPCPAPGPGVAKCEPNNRYIPAAQIAKALAAKQKIIIIDARPPSDWMRVHVTGAVSIPYHDTKRLDEIKNDGTWVIAYCACPHHLSGEIVDALRAKGIKTSAILDEGILEWHRLGFPVVTAPGVQPPPKQVPEPVLQ